MERLPFEGKVVRQRLALYRPDLAALRRYLVDSGLMTRLG